MSASEEESQGPIIRDRRRIDPVTGQVRQPQSDSSAGEQSSGRGQAVRGPGQARPGKHSASKPGSPRQEAAGAGAGQNGNGGAANTGTKADGKAEELAVKLADRTADLQRVQA